LEVRIPKTRSLPKEQKRTRPSGAIGMMRGRVANNLAAGARATYDSFKAQLRERMAQIEAARQDPRVQSALQGWAAVA